MRRSSNQDNDSSEKKLGFFNGVVDKNELPYII